MQTLKIRAAVIMLILGFASQASASEPLFYFSSDDDGGNSWIEKVTAGQAEAKTVYHGWYQGRPQMVSIIRDHLYWTTYYPGEVWRSGPNGEDPVRLADQGRYTTTRAIEYHNGKVYWSNEPMRSIFRANLDGSDIETVISSDAFDYAVWDFTILGDRIYWTRWDGNCVRSIGLDGTDYQQFSVPGAQRLFSIESLGNRLCITDLGDVNRILAVDPDGGNLQVVHSSPLRLNNMDTYGDRIYFGDSTGPYWDIATRIYSVSAAGGDETIEFEGNTNGYLWQLHVVPEPNGLVFAVICALTALRRGSRAV